jgi:hypothetical protein
MGRICTLLSHDIILRALMKCDIQTNNGAIDSKASLFIRNIK